MRVLILGAGMYVTGRDGTGDGTILASLAQISRSRPISQVMVMARNPNNAAHVATAISQINTKLQTSLSAAYYQIDGINLESEVATICSIERFDLAIVAVPDHLHIQAVKALLMAGVPTLVVKPFVSSIAEAIELLGIQRETGVYGAVEFHKRFDEGNRYAKKIIANDELGDLKYISVDYSQRIQIPTRIFRGWVERTNIFQYLGVHYVDLIWFLTGFRPRRLTAYGTCGVLQQQGIKAFDSIHVMLEWASSINPENRFLSIFNTNWIDPDCSSAMSDQRYKLIGTKGRLECDQRNRGIELVREGGGTSFVNPYFSSYLPDADGKPEFQGYGFKSIARFVEDVGDLVEGRTTVALLEAHRPTFSQALVSTVVIDAVNRALTVPPAWREIYGLS